MTEFRQAREDLSYVAAALRRGEPASSRGVFLLWAVLVPIGFALADLLPQYCAPFWFVAGPAGGIASFWVGRRAALAQGQTDKELGRRHGLHWGCVAVAFALVGFSAATGRIDATSAIKVFMLLNALAYVLAGIHLDRKFLPSGVVMFAGYAALTWLDIRYVWTVTGLIVGVALALAAFQGRTAAR